MYEFLLMSKMAKPRGEKLSVESQIQYREILVFCH